MTDEKMSPARVVWLKLMSFVYSKGIELREKLHTKKASPIRIFWWKLNFFFYKSAIVLNEKLVRKN